MWEVGRVQDGGKDSHIEAVGNGHVRSGKCAAWIRARGGRTFALLCRGGRKAAREVCGHRQRPRAGCIPPPACRETRHAAKGATAAHGDAYRVCFPFWEPLRQNFAVNRALAIFWLAHNLPQNFPVCVRIVGACPPIRTDFNFFDGLRAGCIPPLQTSRKPCNQPGHGYFGRVTLNPHRAACQPSCTARTRPDLPPQWWTPPGCPPKWQ